MIFKAGFRCWFNRAINQLYSMLFSNHAQDDDFHGDDDFRHGSCDGPDNDCDDNNND